MDMWQGYIGAVQTHAPQVAIVFDRFHIERYLTKAVDDVRKQGQRERIALQFVSGAHNR